MGYKDPDKQREYQRNWQAKRRAEFFKGKRCRHCLGTDSLELDHIDPTSKVSHSIWSWSAAKRAAEIAKCQILCRECHRDKTYKNDLPNMWGYQYGFHGRARYAKGCRCDICRAGHTEFMRGYRDRMYRERIAARRPAALP